jgi:iron complex outermembrane receptor protein
MQRHVLIRTWALMLPLILASTLANSQTKLKGYVVDLSSGEPLLGASVFLDEYRTGTTTGFDGEFEFNSREVGKAQLVVSMIGYATHRQEVALGSEMWVLDLGRIGMTSSTIGLSEANVIASVAIDREKPRCGVHAGCQNHSRAAGRQGIG